MHPWLQGDTIDLSFAYVQVALQITKTPDQSTVSVCVVAQTARARYCSKKRPVSSPNPSCTLPLVTLANHAFACDEQNLSHDNDTLLAWPIVVQQTK